MHFKEFCRAAHTFTDILSGDVNYPAVMEALKYAEYNGYLTAEVSLLKDYPQVSLKNIASSMKAIVK